MNGMRGIRWGVMALLAVGLVSCKVKRPDTVLSDEKLEAVLYDYHVAKAMGEQLSYDEGYKRVLYLQSVFRKHGITEAQFDTSMVWLTRNPDILRDIYERVNERLRAEKDQVEDLIALRDNKPKESLPGDSIDVWAWDRVYHLTGMPLDNLVAFDLPSDPNFQDRDTLRWSLRFRFMGKTAQAADTLYAPVMALQIAYGNDSVLHALRRIDRPGVETLTVGGDTLGRIENVRGFVYYPRQSAGRVLLVDSVSLMRYHAQGDSTAVAAPAAAASPAPAPSVGASRPLQSSRTLQPSRPLSSRPDKSRP